MNDEPDIVKRMNEYLSAPGVAESWLGKEITALLFRLREAETPGKMCKQCMESSEEIIVLEDRLKAAEEKHAVPPSRGCPCTYGNPCSDRCTCAVPSSSTGCLRCCRYGSEEQRRAAADRIIAAAERSPDAQ